MDLTNEDVADILALLDSLPYDELDLQTTRFRLTLRRTPDGWTQSTQVLAGAGETDGEGEAELVAAIGRWGPQRPSIGSRGPHGPVNETGAGARSGDGEVTEVIGDGEEDEVELGAGRTPTGGAGEDSEAGEVGRHAGEVSGAAAGRTEGDGGAAAGRTEGDGGAAAGRTERDGGAAAGRTEGDGGAAAEEVGEGELVAVRAPLPGTFYRAPRPGAPPFVEVGSRVRADTVVGIVETMKLMNSVHAGADGTVAEICLGNAEFAAHGATLMRIRALR